MKWIVGLALTLTPCILGAFPLWLENPTRKNPFDPKSSAPLFPTVTPTFTVPSATISPTRTISPLATATVTPTVTQSSTSTIAVTDTNTPVDTFTATLTFTDSPAFTKTITPTITVTPTLSATLTVTRTNTVAPPSDTFTVSPTFTQTPCGGGMYEDFEAGTGAYSDFYPWATYPDWSGCSDGEGIGIITVDSPGTMHPDGGNNAWHLTIINDNSMDCWMSALDPVEGQFGLYWIGSQGPYGGNPPNVCYTGATTFTFWTYADTAISLDVYIDENSSGACSAPADKETFVSSTVVSDPGDSAWHKQTVNLSSFAYAGSTPCDGVLDPQHIAIVWFNVREDHAYTSLWMDNYRFE